MINEKIELQAKRYMDAKMQKQKAELMMENAKEILEKLMRESDSSQEIIPYDEEYNIKVRLSLDSRRKLNKTDLAEELSVEESSINTEFLLNSVEKRKLTTEQYKKHFYRVNGEKVGIRLVKAKEEKK